MDLKNLEHSILALATLDRPGAPVISCYLGLDTGGSNWRGWLSSRVCQLRSSLDVAARAGFEEAWRPIETFLASSLLPAARGTAIFSRGGGEPFFLPLQFRVPVPPYLAVDTVPNIYHLVELRDDYHRYVVLHATGAELRIFGVNLGASAMEIWRQQPECGRRIGREWIREHYRRRYVDQTSRSFDEYNAILSQLMSDGGLAHLVLSGDPQVAARLRRSLPRPLAARLAGVVPAFFREENGGIMPPAPDSQMEGANRKSETVAEKIRQEIMVQGLAAAGTGDTYYALREERVDVLLMAGSYDPGPAWICSACGHAQLDHSFPSACLRCGAMWLRRSSIREEMNRLAATGRAAVETVGQCRILTRLGGVACLVRYHPLGRLGRNAFGTDSQARDYESAANSRWPTAPGNRSRSPDGLA